MPVQRTYGVEHHLVGHRAEVVGALHVVVGVSVYLLARCLEVCQRTAQLLHRGGVGTKSTALQPDGFYVIVLLGHLDGLEHLVEAEGRLIVAHEGRQGIVAMLLVQHTAEVQVQHAVALYRRNIAVARHEAHNDGYAYEGKYYCADYKTDS